MPRPTTTSLQSSVRAALSSARFSVVGEHVTPPRPAVFERVPAGLTPALLDALQARHPRGLYRHQSAALEAYVAGQDVCVATATASGKSLVFQAAAVDTVLRDPEARVLVLYPARALIQDQGEKWRQLLGPLGLSFAFIDGGVPVEQRAELLRRHRIVLMTADVAHAWLLGRCAGEPPRSFLSRLRLLVLDEAHVYEGVFGTNTAYLLRRLQCAAGPHRLIAASATVHDPAGFLQRLTGRTVRVIDAALDGAPTPGRTLLHVTADEDADFAALARLVACLGAGGERFLAFADSRQLVERLVAASRRSALRLDGEDDTPTEQARVLPYRAGYEQQDRLAIQAALAEGTLVGVVATSALELGIDLGEINLVVLLGPPPSVRSLHQRLGRAGRRAPAVGIVVDQKGVLDGTEGAFRAWLERPLEPNCLYLDNRYLVYTNALCAAVEARACGFDPSAGALGDLPDGFRALLANELDPQLPIADDLYPLKQRAEGGPHLEFPIRHGAEASFRVEGGAAGALGTLSYSQVLREAYPGAVYYYLARPYRVRSLNRREGTITVTREQHLTTRPVAQSMVFPSFAGAHSLRRSASGFVAEVAVQVSERVLGFVELRGGTRVEHRYGPGSPWAQRELGNFYATTGVCWHFPRSSTAVERVGEHVLRAFCGRFGVHERDVGVGVFHAKANPLGSDPCRGLCVFDATPGSLRLTAQLADRFVVVLDDAVARAEAEGDEPAAAALRELRAHAAEARPVGAEAPGGASVFTAEGEWMDVVADGERAIYNGSVGAREVTVVSFRYTPRGALYDLVPEQPGVRWQVAAATVQPIHGVTRTVRTNLVTGETVTDARP